MRDIREVLYFRSDISPFLIHLTRDSSNLDAESVLRRIINEKQLRPGNGEISDARFAIRTSNMSQKTKRRYFGAICFTETPLNEIHCLFDVSRRQIQLQPYGLVFLKSAAVSRGVEPVLYFNNEQGDKDPVVKALCSLIETNRNAAARILPLIAIFGKKLQPPGARPQSGQVDFTWEREWRYVPVNGEFVFKKREIFVGLCPDVRIDEFESLWPGVEFVDPTKNLKRYAPKLIRARQRLAIKNSVI